MHSDITSQEVGGQAVTNNSAAKSSTRPRIHIIGRLLFCWSWFVAGALLLVVAPPVLLLGSLFRRQTWIYWWANWGARTWLTLTGVKVKVFGRELLDPNQPYVFVSNHYSYLDAAPLFAYTGRRMGMIGKKELLKAPILGMLLRKIAVARFCRTLATLTASGVPILDGLQITARTAGNSIIEDAIMATRKSVEEGKTISEPLGDTDVFPPMVVQMIAVGEQTGALDTMLSKIADFYEDEVDIAVAGLMKLLEPVLIAFLGVAIGGIVIAMYMPMFALIGQIG